MWKKSSPFYERPEDPRARESREADIVAGVQKTASIPHDVLESWISSLDLAENGGDVQDVVSQMRSYFPG